MSNEDLLKVCPERASAITHALDKTLALSGAIINGKRTEIAAASIEIKNALKRTTSESSSSSVGIGILIGWSGAIMPQFSVGMSNGFENSGLVEFLSEITGDDVQVVAERIAADLEQITTKVQTKERVPSSGPKAFMDKQSSGFSLTVSKTPSISFFVEETDLSGTRRTSGTFSKDLIDGLKVIDGWLSPTQAPQEQTAPLDKKRKKPAPIKLLDEKAKSKLSDKQRKTLEPIVKDIETSLEDIKQTAQNKGLLHIHEDKVKNPQNYLPEMERKRPIAKESTPAYSPPPHVTNLGNIRRAFKAFCHKALARLMCVALHISHISCCVLLGAVDQCSQRRTTVA